MDSADYEIHPRLKRHLEWKRKATQPGIRIKNGEVEAARFIPHGEVKARLALPEIEALLSAISLDKPVNPSSIQSDCRILLCILLAIGRGRYIGLFYHYGLQDRSLPFSRSMLLEKFPHDRHRDLVDSFYCEQWEWCAREFRDGLDNVEFEPLTILPVTSYTPLARGTCAQVFKVELHSDYNFLLPHRSFHVLKVYKHNKIDEYEAEVTAYRKIHQYKQQSPDLTNIVRYHGSFWHGGAGTVILEHADVGTLDEFWKNTTPPTTAEDGKRFWRAFLGLAAALRVLHLLDVREFGIHYDIKPANILVLRGNGRYDYTFRLSDLTTSHFRKRGLQPWDYDRGGTRIYGAPECCQPDSEASKWPITVYPHIDVWSLGGVFSEGVIWSIGGWDSLTEYRRRRKDAIAEEHPGFRDPGAFHDGTAPLAVIRSMHQEMLQNRRMTDHIAPAVAKMVERDMLVTTGRVSAEEVDRRRHRIIESRPKDPREDVRQSSMPGPFQEDFRPDSQPEALRTSPPSPPQKPSHRQRDSVTSPRPSSSVLTSPRTPSPQVRKPPLLTYTKALQCLAHWESRSRFFRKFESRIKCFPNESGFAEISGREHAFLIDNSQSMQSQSQNVEGLLRVLGKMAKEVDNDGLDLFVSGAEKPLFGEPKVSKHLEFMRKAGYHDAPDISAALGRVLDAKIYRPFKRAYAPTPKPLSLYVFTDGAWEWTLSADQVVDSQLMKEIKDVVDFIQGDDLKRRHMLRDNHVAIQFIRFGKSPEGKARLKYLDDGIKSEGSGVNLDIIDTEDFEGGCIWKMLIGAVNRNWDHTLTGSAS